MNTKEALSQIWRALALDPAALERVTVPDQSPALPSSFAVCTAAQASIAAAALAASEVARAKTGRDSAVSVDPRHAALECLSYFEINGKQPNLWDKYSGTYRCADGWVRIHANFAHHREGALGVLGLQPGEATPKSAVEAALQSWKAVDYESACAERGLVVAALRTRAQWCAHPQFSAVSVAPLISIKKIAIQIQKTSADTGFWQKSDLMKPANRPLAGLRVLELTRILAGPVCGRALAAYGADVLLVNGPHLPNIDAIADTSRGKRSAQVDLRTIEGRGTLTNLIREADVFVQGYRPGGLAKLGFGPEDLARINPRIVTVALSAYGEAGPWAQRRGFDSLVQTATGLNADESDAAGIDLGHTAPRAFPMQILDCGAGYLMAAAVSTLLLRQRREGGAWHAHVSLARTAEWLRSLGRLENGLDIAATSAKELVAPYAYTQASGFGELTALTHSAKFDDTATSWQHPSMPPGSHVAAWGEQ